MRVVLATPPEYRRLSTPAQGLGEPMALLYLASYAKDLGFLDRASASIEIFDAYTLHMKPEGFIREMVERKPDVLGVTLTSRMFLAAMACLSKIHDALPDMRIVLGGIHPSFTARNIVEAFPFIDCVIKGEGERAFSQLLLYYAGELSDISGIPGITVASNGRIIEREPETIWNLDCLPFPARNLVKNIRYGYSWNGIDLTYGKFTSIVTSRGCPFGCKFCTNWVFTNRQLRARSVENVVSELELIQSQGYKSCVIVDDIYTANKKRVVEMCDEIVKRKIDLVLYCEGRTDSADPLMFKSMKRAGFSSILFGMESGSQKVLDFFNKGMTPTKIKTAAANAKNAGLQVIGAFIIGAPVETVEDIKATLELISELDLDGLEVNALGISPWDPLYNEVAGEGRVKPGEWMRDHLVSDYFENLTQQELAKWLEQAYYAFFHKGLASNLKKLIRYMVRSRDGRNAIIRNIMNPYAWRLIRERGKPRHKIEEVLRSGSDLEFMRSDMKVELAPAIDRDL
jgi:anaerobic magnesium-protoporphyrin IX monomethyl ester cyclase